ncbi:MAG TPA: luciferase family protein [Candidatus Bathyarchaeia archaeon]|nr:luciferase family protein [Candidatus Bathyarchaeia archaeon]
MYHLGLKEEIHEIETEDSLMIKELKDWVLQLGEVTEAPHRFGGTEFRVQNQELMHNHGPRHLDIRLSKEDQERMLKEGKAEPHMFAPQAGWITYRIRSDDDLETAKELVRLAYDNARKTVAGIQKGKVDHQKLQ